jgi:hypothetical protein
MEVSEGGVGGSNFTKVAGKKDAPKMKMAPMRIESMEHAIARSQNPANAGRGGNAESSRIAGITSGGWPLCGTYTGPICATLTGAWHCGQTLEPSGISAPHFSQVKIASLQGKPQET